MTNGIEGSRRERMVTINIGLIQAEETDGGLFTTFVNDDEVAVFDGDEGFLSINDELSESVQSCLNVD